MLMTLKIKLINLRVIPKIREDRNFRQVFSQIIRAVIAKIICYSVIELL